MIFKLIKNLKINFSLPLLYIIIMENLLSLTDDGKYLQNLT